MLVYCSEADLCQSFEDHVMFSRKMRCADKKHQAGLGGSQRDTITGKNSVRSELLMVVPAN